ncbi:MAG: hypothetical protein JWQ35_2794 [Bacteriovoracaceae bacterium]|nr:hypothetical protein [Bacteriovoracaceae bacterium]
MGSGRFILFICLLCVCSSQNSLASDCALILSDFIQKSEFTVSEASSRRKFLDRVASRGDSKSEEAMQEWRDNTLRVSPMTSPRIWKVIGEAEYIFRKTNSILTKLETLASIDSAIQFSLAVENFESQKIEDYEWESDPSPFVLHRLQIEKTNTQIRRHIRELAMSAYDREVVMANDFELNSPLLIWKMRDFLQPEDWKRVHAQAEKFGPWSRHLIARTAEQVSDGQEIDYQIGSPDFPLLFTPPPGWSILPNRFQSVLESSREKRPESLQRIMQWVQLKRLYLISSDYSYLVKAAFEWNRPEVAISLISQFGAVPDPETAGQIVRIALKKLQNIKSERELKLFSDYILAYAKIANVKEASAKLLDIRNKLPLMAYFVLDDATEILAERDNN